MSSSPEFKFFYEATDSCSPPLLLIFFHDKGWLVPNSSVTSPPRSTVTSDKASSLRPSSKQPHFEFLLFSYLLRFVHREGKIGDFARAGLLFLFDIAFLPPMDEEPEGSTHTRAFRQDDPLLMAQQALVEYITDGDFADVMAAGLGATWSLLPSKLRVPTLSDGPTIEDDDAGSRAMTSGGMVLGGSGDDSASDEDENVVILSTDEDVRNQLDMLLKLLGFLQDITTRCQTPSPTPSTVEADEMSDLAHQPVVHSMGQSVIDQALDSVKKSFLDSVVYPSILECSSHDGSAVAIMTYLDTIFCNLDDGRVTTRLLTYLLNTTDRDEEDAESDERYTLRDLLVANLSPDSPSSAATTAALVLVRSLLVEHCRVSTSGLLRTLRDPLSETMTVLHNDNEADEAAIYSGLLSRLDRSSGFELEQSSNYTHYLTDMQSAIQDDRCYQLSHLHSPDDLEHAQSHGHHWDDQYGMKRHKLSPTDPLLRSLLQGLGRFLYASPDENVALTGVVVALATCPYRSLQGWLLYEPPERDPWTTRGGYHPSESDTKDVFSHQSREVRSERPAIYQILQDLTAQISKYRTTHPEFDKLLSERRRGLLFTDHMDEAINVPLDFDSNSTPQQSIFGGIGGGMTTPTRSPLPKKRAGMMGTITSFLTPNRSSPKPTSSSPSPSLAPGPSTPVQQIARSTRRETGENSSPYKGHYDGVAGHQVEVTHSPIRSGAWSPANTTVGPMERATSSFSETRPSSSLSRDTGPSTLGPSPSVAPMADSETTRQVGLSTVLDNIIILEEFIKELVALVNARRSLGIDRVRFD